MYSIVFLFLLAACKLEEPKVETDLPIPVKVETLVAQDLPLHLELIGTLTPSISLDLYPAKEGILHEVKVSEGSPVKAGTPLFQIDPQMLQLKLKEAEAKKAMDLAAYASIQRKLKRFHCLQDKDLVAEAEWDKIQTELEKAAHQVDLDQTQIEMIALDLERCTLLSPFDGEVRAIKASSGTLAKPITPLATLVKTDPLIVEFSLTEKEFEALNNQKKISIHLLHHPETSHSGEISFIDPEFQTGKVLIKAKIPNPDHILRPGQLSRVHIPLQVRKNTLLIPQKAVKRKKEGTYVYLIEDGVARLRAIDLGEEIGKEVIVKTGLQAGEMLITEGHIRLYPDAKVVIQ